MREHVAFILYKKYTHIMLPRMQFMSDGVLLLRTKL